MLPGLVASDYFRGRGKRGRRITFPGWVLAKVETLSEKQIAKGLGGMAQVVEHFASMRP
jgi:hypothetical protein